MIADVTKVDDSKKGNDYNDDSESSTSTEKIDNGEIIVENYIPIVMYIASKVITGKSKYMEFDDLVGYGVFGLIDAIDKFDYGKNVKFETYASLRIRGAILDQIRKMDWIPRSLRQKQRKIEAAISKLETELGRTATNEEIAAELGISQEEYLNWQGQSNISNIVSLDEFMEASGEKEIEPIKANSYDQPEQVLEKKELKKLIIESLDSLTEKERKVILLYYYEELTLKEISRVLEVSESRISQLHTKALQKMRTKMGSYIGILVQ